jgi:AcrR family transcriptional regulator
MPYQTFFNLPEEKRQSVIDAALEEFSLHDYKTASLSRMVEKAGIAKGSMYQYFENKKDLYLYLMDHAAGVKLRYLQESTSGRAGDFFDLLKEISQGSTRFNLSQPKYSRLLYHAAREKYNEDLGDLASQLREVSRNYLKDLMLAARERGEIRRDIDMDLASFCVSQISIDLEDFMSAKYGYSYSDILKESRDSLPITSRQVDETLEDMIGFFRRGLERQSSN